MLPLLFYWYRCWCVGVRWQDGPVMMAMLLILFFVVFASTWWNTMSLKTVLPKQFLQKQQSKYSLTNSILGNSNLPSEDIWYETTWAQILRLLNKNLDQEDNITGVSRVALCTVATNKSKFDRSANKSVVIACNSILILLLLANS